MKATIYYWYSDWSEYTGFNAGEVIEGKQAIYEAIDYILSLNIPSGKKRLAPIKLNVMLSNYSDGELYIAIDDKRFSQR